MPLHSSPISYLLTKKMTSSSQSNTSNLVPYEIEQRTNGLHIHLVKIRLYFLRVRECMESTFEEGLLSAVLLKSYLPPCSTDMQSLAFVSLSGGPREDSSISSMLANSVYLEISCYKGITYRLDRSIRGLEQYADVIC